MDSLVIMRMISLWDQGTGVTIIICKGQGNIWHFCTTAAPVINLLQLISPTHVALAEMVLHCEDPT